MHSAYPLLCQAFVCALAVVFCFPLHLHSLFELRDSRTRSPEAPDKVVGCCIVYSRANLISANLTGGRPGDFALIGCSSDRPVVAPLANSFASCGSPTARALLESPFGIVACPKIFLTWIVELSGLYHRGNGRICGLCRPHFRALFCPLPHNGITIQ